MNQIRLTISPRSPLSLNPKKEKKKSQIGRSLAAQREKFWSTFLNFLYNLYIKVSPSNENREKTFWASM